MTDFATLATLGIALDASGAEITARRFGKTLDEMGAKGTAAAQGVTSASDRVTGALGTQYATLQEAQRAWLAQAAAMAGSSQAMQLSTAEIARASTAWDAMIGNLKAVPPVAAEAAQSFSRLEQMASGGGLGIGRLRQSFSSLAAQATGTSPVIDRILSTVGSFAVGNVWMIGVLLGVAALGAAWKFLHKDADDLAESAKKATEELEKMLRARSLGSANQIVTLLYGDPTDPKKAGLYQQIGQDEKKLADMRANLNKHDNLLTKDQQEARIVTLQDQLAREEKERDDARAVLLDIYQKNTAQTKETQDRTLADLISHNLALHGQREQALAIYKDDLAKLAALQQLKVHTRDPVTGADTTLLEEGRLANQIDTLKGALYPKAAGAQGNRADDTVTRFTDELAQMHRAATSFGKDDTIDTRMAAFVERINQAEVALKRLHKTNTGPQIAALEGVKAQVPALGDEFKAQVQTVFNTSVDARLRKMQEENDAQLRLNAARNQGADALDAVMIANAGALAVDAEQARATQQYVVLTQQYRDAIRALGEQHKRDEIAAEQPRRALTAAQDVIGEVRQHAELNTGSPAADLQQINRYYVDAIDYQNGLVRGTLDWKSANEAVNALFRERKTLEVAIATKPLTDLVQPALVTQLQVEIGDAGGTSKAQRDQLDAAMKAAREAAIVEAAKEVQATLASNKPLNEKVAILEKIKQYLQSIGALSGPSLTPGQKIQQVAQGAAMIAHSGVASDIEGVGANAALAFSSGGANIPADFAALNDSMKLFTDIFNANAANIQEQKQIQRENTAALVQMTLKLQGFIAASVSNADKAVQAIKAFEASPSAVKQLTEAQSSTGWSGRHYGDLQTQIKALQPFLTAMGLTYDQFKAVAAAEGLKIFDNQGRLSAAGLAAFTAGVAAATQAAFTLSKSFAAADSFEKLKNEAYGKSGPRADYDAALAAFNTAAPNAGLPKNINLDSLAGENATRTWVQGVLAAEQKARDTGTAFDYSKYGNFQSADELNGALGTLISPLNQLTNTVNGVIDSLTHVPSGFKAAQDRFLASLPEATPGTDTAGPLAAIPAAAFPNPNAGLTGSAFTATTGLSPALHAAITTDLAQPIVQLTATLSQLTRTLAVVSGPVPVPPALRAAAVPPVPALLPAFPAGPPIPTALADLTRPAITAAAGGNLPSRTPDLVGPLTQLTATLHALQQTLALQSATTDLALVRQAMQQLAQVPTPAPQLPVQRVTPPTLAPPPTLTKASADTYNITMNVTSSATNVRDLAKELEAEWKRQSARGGTTPFSSLTGGTTRGLL